MTQPANDGALLDALLGPMAEQVRGVNLPLHILLEGRFGELNDNQLEMIHEAQDAARAADRTLRLVQRVRALRGIEPAPGSDLCRVTDLLRAPLLQARALAADCGVALDVDLAPDLPHVRVDRAAVEESISVLLETVVSASRGGEVRVDAAARADAVDVRVTPGHRNETDALKSALTELLLVGCGSSIAGTAQRTVVTLPRAEMPRDARQ